MYIKIENLKCMEKFDGFKIKRIQIENWKCMENLKDLKLKEFKLKIEIKRMREISEIFVMLMEWLYFWWR